MLTRFNYLQNVSSLVAFVEVNGVFAYALLLCPFFHISYQNALSASQKEPALPSVCELLSAKKRKLLKRKAIFFLLFAFLKRNQ